MRVKNKIAAVAFGIVMLAAMFVSAASAECGPMNGAKFQKQSWDGMSSPASLLQVNFPFFNEPIVGMWHVIFTAKGNTGAMAPPDGTPIDNAIVVWHSDGTEIMNSGRPAQDGNFCLGVWEPTGRFRYKVNHFALGNDTTNAPSGIGNPAGPTHIQESVALGLDGNHYSGTFILDATDTSGNVVAHILGVIKATRITVNTPVSSFF